MEKKTNENREDMADDQSGGGDSKRQEHDATGVETPPKQDVVQSSDKGAEISQSEQVVPNIELESVENRKQDENVDDKQATESVIMEVEVDDEDQSASVRELLDGIEARVESLRLAAEDLRREQAELLGSLEEVGASTKAGGQLQHLGEVDREEVNLEVARLAARVNTVRVEVTMVRSEGQKESLERVEDKISDLVAKVQSGDEVQSALAECKALLAACSEGEIVGGGANQKFEQLVLGCSARDQKEVKGRLENLLEQISALASFKN